MNQESPELSGTGLKADDAAATNTTTGTTGTTATTGTSGTTSRRRRSTSRRRTPAHTPEAAATSEAAPEAATAPTATTATTPTPAPTPTPAAEEAPAPEAAAPAAGTRASTSRGRRGGTRRRSHASEPAVALVRPQTAAEAEAAEGAEATEAPEAPEVTVPAGEATETRTAIEPESEVFPPAATTTTPTIPPTLADAAAAAAAFVASTGTAARPSTASAPVVPTVPTVPTLTEAASETPAPPATPTATAAPATAAPEATPPTRRYRFDRPRTATTEAQAPFARPERLSGALSGSGSNDNGNGNGNEIGASEAEPEPPVASVAPEPIALVPETLPAEEEAAERPREPISITSPRAGVGEAQPEAEEAEQQHEGAGAVEAEGPSSRRRRRRRRGNGTSLHLGETGEADGEEPPYAASQPTTGSRPHAPYADLPIAAPSAPEAENGYGGYDEFEQQAYGPYMPAARETRESRDHSQVQEQEPGWNIGSAYSQMNRPASPFGGPEPSFARGFGPQPSGVAGPARETYPRTGRGERGLDSPPMSANQLGAVITQAISRQTDRLLSELRHQQQPPAMTVMLPAYPSTERVGVFVDVANLLYSARTLRMAVDFGRLLDFLRGNRRLVRAQAYAPTNPDPRADQQFLSAVQGLGYRITTKNYKTFASGAKKADLDLDLCMDIVRLVDAKAVDTVTLVSGDSDFLPLLDYCSDHGVRVEVAAFEDAAAMILRQSCDLFINLSLVDEIRA